LGNALGTKLYYSIGEVAELTELAPYTLRAWEGEFSCLRPKRVHGKNRAYRERDIAIILLIRRLLHEERYSTRGAQQKLRNEPELIRGAVEYVARLCASENQPSLEELASAGSNEGQTSGSTQVPEKAEVEPVSRADKPANGVESGSEAAPALALLAEVRDELRTILTAYR
jgi:DNA-binding transcriptional MerR regulator